MKTLSDIYNGIVNSPSKTFAALEKESISYKELHARILRFSGLFAQLDVQCDQRIILCSDNESFIISAVAAAFLNGISSTVLTTETSLARVESIVEQAQPQLILIDAGPDILLNGESFETYFPRPREEGGFPSGSYNTDHNKIFDNNGAEKTSKIVSEILEKKN